MLLHPKDAKTAIVNDRQRWVDEPIIKRIDVAPTVNAVRMALGRKPLRKIESITGFTRVQLQWMVPGKNGELVPRE